MPLHPRLSGSHSKDPWWYPNTWSLMVIKAGHSHSWWCRSCSSTWQFGQIRSCEGSSRLRYCFREGWWPDLKQARRTSSFLLFICFVSWKTHRWWYTVATHSHVGGVSRIVSLMTWMELGKEIERIMFVAMVVASLTALSTKSLPGMEEWPGIHWIKVEDEMELMKLWIENVRGRMRWDEMRWSEPSGWRCADYVYDYWLAWR